VVAGVVLAGVVLAGAVEAGAVLAGAVDAGAVLAGAVLAGVVTPGLVVVLDEPQADTPAATVKLKPKPNIALLTARHLRSMSGSLSVAKAHRMVPSKYIRAATSKRSLRGRCWRGPDPCVLLPGPSPRDWARALTAAAYPSAIHAATSPVYTAEAPRRRCTVRRRRCKTSERGSRHSCSAWD
jgi:hypothetical protein